MCKKIYLLLFLVLLMSLVGCSQFSKPPKTIMNNSIHENMPAFDIKPVTTLLCKSEFINFAIKDDENGGYEHTGYPNIQDKTLVQKTFTVFSECGAFYPMNKIELTYPKGTLYINSLGGEVIICPPRNDKVVLSIRTLEGNREKQYYLSTDHALYDRIKEISIPYSIELAKTMANQFIIALQNEDKDAMKRLTYDSDAVIDGWKDFEISSASLMQVNRNGPYGLFEVTFEVKKQGTTPFKNGINKRMLQIGEHELSHGNCALSFKEKRRAVVNNDVIELVQLWLSYTQVKTFENPSEINKDTLLEFVIMLAQQELSKDVFTQIEIDSIANKHFGMKSLAMTDSRFFNKDRGLYQLFGRDSVLDKYSIVNYSYNQSNSIHSVYIEFYRDGLQTEIENKVLFSLYGRDKNSLRFVSAKVY